MQLKPRAGSRAADYGLRSVPYDGMSTTNAHSGAPAHRLARSGQPRRTPANSGPLFVLMADAVSQLVPYVLSTEVTGPTETTSKMEARFR